MELKDKLTYLMTAYNEALSSGRVHNKKEFAEWTEVNPSSLSAAMNGNEKYLTDSMLSKIKARMEDVQDNCIPSAKLIPVIPTEALAGSLMEFAGSFNEHECEKMVSPIKGADMAITIYGDSMAPEYTSGSIAIIKKVNEQAFIEWGKVYVLDTENGAVIKQVRKTDNPAVIECVSLNPAYQPFTINLRHINGWYRVLMVMSAK